jgi:hypothetical protein
MTETHTHEHAEHSAPAKKRTTRKKVVHHKTHAELELDAFLRKMQTAINVGQQGLQHSHFHAYNEQQLKALKKKIEKRLRTVELQRTQKV